VDLVDDRIFVPKWILLDRQNGFPLNRCRRLTGSVDENRSHDSRGATTSMARIN
jgi:hypothetical protein